jgi:hypothetical protein
LTAINDSNLGPMDAFLFGKQRENFQASDSRTAADWAEAARREYRKLMTAPPTWIPKGFSVFR